MQGRLLVELGQQFVGCECEERGRDCKTGQVYWLLRANALPTWCAGPGAAAAAAATDQESGAVGGTAG